jgi:hypothetical protein
VCGTPRDLIGLVGLKGLLELAGSVGSDRVGRARGQTCMTFFLRRCDVNSYTHASKRLQAPLSHRGGEGGGGTLTNNLVMLVIVGGVAVRSRRERAGQGRLVCYED